MICTECEFNNPNETQTCLACDVLLIQENKTLETERLTNETKQLVSSEKIQWNKILVLFRPSLVLLYGTVIVVSIGIYIYQQQLFSQEKILSDLHDNIHKEEVARKDAELKGIAVQNEAKVATEKIIEEQIQRDKEKEQEIKNIQEEVERLKQETEKNNLKIEKSNIAQLRYLNLLSGNLSIPENVESQTITTEVTLVEQRELKQLSQNWIIAHSSKDITLFSSLYDDFILFYGTEKNKNSTLAAKLRLFKKFPDLQQQIYGDIQFEKQTDGTIKGDFTKRVRVTINQGITDYPAYLIFRKSNNGWKIAAESDLQTDKNIAKKSNTGDIDSVVN